MNLAIELPEKLLGESTIKNKFTAPNRIINASPSVGYQPVGLLYSGLAMLVTTETLGSIIFLHQKLKILLTKEILIYIIKNRTYMYKIILLVLIISFLSCSKDKNDNIFDSNTDVTKNSDKYFIENTDTNNYFNGTIIINTNIDIDINSSPNILKKAITGLSQTDFKLKRDYFDEKKYIDGILIVSTLEDLKIIQEKYIELPYLDEFSSVFFENNYMAIISQPYGAGGEFRNEHIEIKNGKYLFMIEHWFLPSHSPEDGERGIALAAIRALYVLQIPKKNPENRTL
jgi:hypothetical protein